MTAHPLPIWALTARAEQAGRMPVERTRYERVPDDPTHSCAECAQQVRVDEYRGRPICRYCGSGDVTDLEDL